MNTPIDTQRRHLLSLAAAAPLALGATRIAHAVPSSETTVMPNAAPTSTSVATPKPLSFDPARLKGLSERLIRSHWENNYGGSVKALAVTKSVASVQNALRRVRSVTVIPRKRHGKKMPAMASLARNAARARSVVSVKHRPRP